MNVRLDVLLLPFEVDFFLQLDEVLFEVPLLPADQLDDLEEENRLLVLLGHRLQRAQELTGVFECNVHQIQLTFMFNYPESEVLLQDESELLDAQDIVEHSVHL